MANYPQSNAIPRFFNQGQPMAFAPGEMILGFQEDPDGVYYINSGYVKTYSISERGDEYVHLIYGAGEIFPIVWAYLGINTRFVFYQAISDVVTWRVAREVFINKIKSDLKFSHALGTQMAIQFKVYNERVDNLEYKKANERIAYRLLFLASRFGIRDNDTITIDAPITHEVFANSINLSRESVSREIERLTQRHIIKRTKHRIVILDVLALKNALSNPINFGMGEPGSGNSRLDDQL